MAATEKRSMWLLQTADNLPAEVKEYPIAGSQGILMPGAPVYICTSGTVKVCDTSDGSDAWHGFLVGLADPTSTWPLTAELAANTKVRVQLIDIADYYGVYVETSGTDAAAAQANVGDQLGLTVSATAGQVGYTTLDTGNANATVQVYDVMGNLDYKTTEFDLTTAPGVAVVRFLNAVVAASKA